MEQIAHNTESVFAKQENTLFWLRNFHFPTIRKPKGFLCDNKQGFTLIELIVSIAIVAAISGIFFANYRQTNNRSDVDMTVQKLVSEIRMVQNFALSLKEFKTYGPPDGGWGVRFFNTDNKVVIFADRNGSRKYRASQDGTIDDEFYKNIVLPDNITINSINIAGITNRPYGYVVFLPPNPDTLIGGAQNENNDNLPNPTDQAEWMEVDFIYNNDVNSVKTIRINKFGLVDVN